MSTVTTSLNSPDSLPFVGYTLDELANYIQRRLGKPVWNVELSRQQVIDSINDALMHYSQWRPKVNYGQLKLVTGQTKYLEGKDVGQIVKVDFVEPHPAPVDMVYGNLIPNPALITNGVDDLDSYVRWRKTWRRVISSTPNWLYDKARKVLYIYNSVDRYYCAVIAHNVYTDTTTLDIHGSGWVKEYALYAAMAQYGDLLMKFSGAIPGPSSSVQLDQGKRQIGHENMARLLAELKAAQSFAALEID